MDHAHAEMKDGRTRPEHSGDGGVGPETAHAELLPQLSHELRVQLQAIAASTAVLRRVQTNESLLRDASSILDRSARELSRLLDDLVDLVSAERGTLALDRSPTPLYELIEHALTCSSEGIARRRLRVVSCRPPAVVMADCDPDRAQRLLTHLLRHAIENLSTGGSLGVCCASSEHHVEVEVTTADAVIADAAQPIVQEPALREHTSTSALVGLHLAYLLASALGGALHMEQLGACKTRISLTLPKH